MMGMKGDGGMAVAASHAFAEGRVSQSFEKNGSI